MRRRRESAKGEVALDGSEPSANGHQPSAVSGQRMGNG